LSSKVEEDDKQVFAVSLAVIATGLGAQTGACGSGACAAVESAAGRIIKLSC